jgi:hypothetical protein
MIFFTDEEKVSLEENEVLEATFFEEETRRQFLNLTQMGL